jgi:hypothetical protein
MPDWHKLVRQRLPGLALDPAERDEVHAELAAHLEESYEGFRKQGLPEREAVRRTLGQVSGWKNLQRKIYAAKNGGHLMQKRLHQLWIPGFLTLILSMLFLAAFQILGFQPRIASSNPNTILRAVAGVASFLRGSRNLPLVSSRRFEGNRASRQRLSRARAYWGVSLDVSNRFDPRTNYREASRL